MTIVKITTREAAIRLAELAVMADVERGNGVKSYIFGKKSIQYTVFSGTKEEVKEFFFHELKDGDLCVVSLEGVSGMSSAYFGKDLFWNSYRAGSEEPLDCLGESVTLIRPTGFNILTCEEEVE